MDYTTRILSRPPVLQDEAVLTDADDSTRSFSFQEYVSAFKNIAVGLRNLGVTQQQTVGLVSRNELWYWVFADGAIAAGAIFAPIPPPDSVELLRTYIQVARVQWLLVAPEFLELASATAAKVGIDASHIIVFDPPGSLCRKGDSVQVDFVRLSEFLVQEEADWQNPNLGKDTRQLLALRLFTSGTSSGPVKAVDVSHSALVCRIDAEDLLPTARDRSQLHFVPAHAAGSQIVTQRALSGRLPLYLSRYDDAASILDRIAVFQISVIQLASRTMESITLAITTGLRSRKALGSLSSVVVGGDSSREAGVAELAALLPSHTVLRTGYASTEAGMVAVSPSHAADGTSWRPCPCYVGYPPVGVEVRIINPDTLETLKPGVEGEVCVRSAQMFSGYCNDPAATAKVMLPDQVGGGAPFFRAGDQGYFDRATSQIVLSGRFNEMFVVNWTRVVPEEVESQLMKHPSIVDVAVTSTAARDLPGALEVIAYVVRGEEVELSAVQVVQFAASGLAPEKTPTGGVIFCENIPRTQTHKVIRSMLASVSALPGSARYIAQLFVT